MRKILLTILAVTIALLLCEMYLRIRMPQQTYDSLPDAESNCYRTDPITFALPKPSSTCVFRTAEYHKKVMIGPQGFVGSTTVAKQKNPAIPRIVFIGDSLTFGQGVSNDESYPSVIRQLFTTQQKHAEIINASMVGAGPNWYYLRLKHTVAEYAPDVVVIGLYIGNDFSDLQYFTSTKTDEKGLPLGITTMHEYIDANGMRRSSSVPMRFRIPILKRSHIFQFITTSVFGAAMSIEQPTANGSPCLLDNSCKELHNGIDETVRLVKGMQHISDDIGAKLVIVLIPWELQLPRELLQRSDIQFFATDKTRHLVATTLMTRLADAHIQTVDLLPAFEAYHGSVPVIYRVDRHWNKTGHTIAAETLFPTLYGLVMNSSKE